MEGNEYYIVICAPNLKLTKIVHIPEIMLQFFREKKILEIMQVSIRIM